MNLISGPQRFNIIEEDFHLYSTRVLRDQNIILILFQYKVYQDVISDVIANVREQFLEDGIDETVLQELKHLWETKLAATKAVDENKEPDKIVGK